MLALLLLVPREKEQALVPIRDTHSFLKADLIKGEKEGEVPKITRLSEKHLKWQRS